ncbi:MAG TPA: hypothetical protein EYQ27_09510, partial [Gemmatimonadetes bacterium]|nr:hypothetical protein [Gemmatimonadota bacterium]
MSFPWPSSFDRVPDAVWAQQPVEALALNYDTVENHGWYSNLDYTVEQVGEYARCGDVLIDYSGGTGILAKRLLDRKHGMTIRNSRASSGRQSTVLVSSSP